MSQMPIQVTPTPLTDCLVKNVEKLNPKTYENFLTSVGGFPIPSKNSDWIIGKKIKPHFTNLTDYLETLAKMLVQEGTVGKRLPNAQAFVIRFNIEWSTARKVQSHSEESRDNKILFSSKSTHYFWLSNFYPSLIFIQSHDVVGYCVETLYQAMKSPLHFDEIVKGIDPLRSKKKHATTTFDNEKRIALMKTLVKEKFDQNLVLKTLLKETNLPLVEHTHSDFWGDGLGEGGKNHLGNILETFRSKLNVPEQDNSKDDSKDDSKDNNKI